MSELENLKSRVAEIEKRLSDSYREYARIAEECAAELGKIGQEAGNLSDDDQMRMVDILADVAYNFRPVWDVVFNVGEEEYATNVEYCDGRANDESGFEMWEASWC